ncbi:hypothetical protein Tco_0948545 [Tanacetum coccineum]
MGTKRATRSTRAPPVTPTPNETTTTVTEAQLQALIDQGVAAAMAEAEASRARNGYNSNGSGPRPAQKKLERKRAPRGAYSRRFQQLALMCFQKVPRRKDKIEKYIADCPI